MTSRRPGELTNSAREIPATAPSRSSRTAAFAYEPSSARSNPSRTYVRCLRAASRNRRTAGSSNDTDRSGASGAFGVSTASGKTTRSSRSDSAAMESTSRTSSSARSANPGWGFRPKIVVPTTTFRGSRPVT